ncbi:hypothetical protein BGZ74_003218 [Mortierella antarctica]|nr:hypothetical protein BGZ74_003218 [Mortierella antarctica]
MMIKEPISTEDGSAPKFESTLVIAFPDVSMAGARVLLSSSSQSTESNRHSITAWSQYCTPPPSRKKKTTTTSTHKDNIPKIVYSASAASTNLGLLTVTFAPPTTEQASHLCEAIVSHARESGTRHIIIVAASNFASQTSETQIIQLHNAASLPLKPVQNNVSLGDHILNTFLTLLTFSDIPTTILVQPAKKGSSIRDTKAVIENLTGALSAAVGSTNAHIFSASRAIAFDSFQREEEEAVESMMYL